MNCVTLAAPLRALVPRGTAVPSKRPTRNDSAFVFTIKHGSKYYGTTHMWDSLPMSSIVAFDSRKVAERIRDDLMTMIHEEGGRLPSFYIDLQTLHRTIEFNAKLPHEASLQVCPVALASLTNSAHECNLTVDVVNGEPAETGFAQTESFAPVYNDRLFAEYLDRMYKS